MSFVIPRKNMFLKNIRNFNYSALTRSQWTCYRCYAQEAQEVAALDEGNKKHDEVVQ